MMIFLEKINPRLQLYTNTSAVIEYGDVTPYIVLHSSFDRICGCLWPQNLILWLTMVS